MRGIEITSMVFTILSFVAAVVSMIFTIVIAFKVAKKENIH